MVLHYSVSKLIRIGKKKIFSVPIWHIASYVCVTKKGGICFLQACFNIHKENGQIGGMTR